MAVGGDVERLSLPLLVSVRGDYGSALNSVGEALRRISLDGAAEGRGPPVAAEVLGVELLQHLDAESLCRLNLCARFFGEEDATTRRSICEDVARTRALDLMDGHVTDLCALEGVSSVRELGMAFRAFLAAFYQCLKLEGNRMFLYLPDCRTRRPRSLAEAAPRLPGLVSHPGRLRSGSSGRVCRGTCCVPTWLRLWLKTAWVTERQSSRRGARRRP